MPSDENPVPSEENPVQQPTADLQNALVASLLAVIGAPDDEETAATADAALVSLDAALGDAA
ncbi:hypothetical protein [Streptomyces sp. NPDC002265]|uniref:hypothetical protein n=1 Tax=Streptomyces sp. NPDC002265 TaxID=3154415 RepID=UPI0033212E24